MRRTTDGREFAVMTHAGRRMEVNPQVWDLLNFMLSDPTRSGKVVIGIAAGNVAHGHIDSLSADGIRKEIAIQEPIYQLNSR